MTFENLLAINSSVIVFVVSFDQVLFLCLKFLVCLHGYESKYNFVETPRKFIIAKLTIRRLGSSLIIVLILLALMKIRAYESKWGVSTKSY